MFRPADEAWLNFLVKPWSGFFGDRTIQTISDHQRIHRTEATEDTEVAKDLMPSSSRVLVDLHLFWIEDRLNFAKLLCNMQGFSILDYRSYCLYELFV